MQNCSSRRFTPLCERPSWTLARAVRQGSLHRNLEWGNRSQDKRLFYGKLDGSGTFFGDDVQNKTRKDRPKNGPDPGL